MKQVTTILSVILFMVSAWLYLDPLNQKNIDLSYLDGTWYSYEQVCNVEQASNLKKVRVINIQNGIFKAFGKESEPSNVREEQSTEEVCGQPADAGVSLIVFGNETQVYATKQEEQFLYMQLTFDDKSYTYKRQI